MPAASGAVGAGLMPLHRVYRSCGMAWLVGVEVRKMVELGNTGSYVFTTPIPLTFSLKAAVLLRPSVMLANVTTWEAVRALDEGPRNGPEKVPRVLLELAAEPLQAT